MYTQNHLTDDHQVDLLISHTDKVIANYRNLVSNLPFCDSYQQPSLEAQIEAAWQQLTGHGDKLSAAKETVMQTITAIEHDYGKLCEDMADIGSGNARQKYDQAISQLENTHRQKLSLYELIAGSISKLERVIASGRPAVKTEKPTPLAARKPIQETANKKCGFPAIAGQPEQKNISSGKGINKPIIDKDLNNLYELDCLGKNKSGSSKPGPKTKVVNTAQPETPADETTKPKRKPYVWDTKSKTVIPIPDYPDDTRESLPPGCSDFKEYLDSAAEKMEDVLTERSYKVLDYAPDRVDNVIDYTHSLSKQLKDYCDHLTPIDSLEKIDANIEDEYAIKEHYQQRLYNAAGLLYEYRAAAESNLRWIQANKILAKEKSPPDSLLPVTAPDILAEHEKQHTIAIEKIDAELKSLQSLIAYFDKKSFPYRDPQKNINIANNDEPVEPANPGPKVKTPLDDIAPEKIEPCRKPASGRSTDSAIYTYRYRSFRDGGTGDLLSATEKCIDHLLTFNAVLPAIDMEGYSDCIQAESQYALKEKHKLDLLQMIGHLNAHGAELTSEINRLTSWISHPVNTDDPRFDLAQKRRQLNEKCLSYNRLLAQITEMIEKSHAAVIEADQKLWPGEKPRDKFDQQGAVFISPEDMHIDCFDFNQ